MDRRLTACNGRVAARSLEGEVQADRFAEGVSARVCVPVAALLRAPEGPREREVMLGAAVTVFETRKGWSFVQAAADGYVGYLRETTLAKDETAPTHRVKTRATHGYVAPDLKSQDRMALPMGVQISVHREHGAFAQTDAGFVPLRHLTPVTAFESDPIAVAERLLGTPYLWGGNSSWGIDCSGFVQIACRFCGISCPGDSDMQEEALGETMAAGAPYQRGDLLFWKGHVGWVAGPDLLLHANAHAMAVAYEPLTAALARIDAQGGGRVTRHARLLR